MYHASELCFAGKRAVDVLQISKRRKAMTVMQDLGLFTECTFLYIKHRFVTLKLQLLHCSFFKNFLL